MPTLPEPGMDIYGASAVEAALPLALADRSVDSLDELLAEEVRWGPDEDTPQTCHGRADVRRRYASLLRDGVTLTVTETKVSANKIMAVLSVRSAEQTDARPRPEQAIQVLTVRDGVIVDIRPAHDRADALRRLLT